MKQKNNRITWLAFASFIAVVIGAGFFGLPWVAAQTGFAGVVVALLVLAPVVIAIHLRFADVVLAIRQRDRMPGYVGRVLGRRWQRFSLGLSLFGFLGSNLAYLILGGTFLVLLLQPLVELRHVTGLLLFFAVGTVFILAGTKSIARLDLILMAIFLGIVLLFAGLAVPRFTPSFLTGFTPGNLILANGIIIFSLWALPMVPESADLLKRRRAAIGRVVASGIGLAALVYLVFTVAVFGVTGPATTEDALTGFVAATGSWLTVVAAAFGLIAVFTSFITQGTNLVETLALDARLTRSAALLVTLGGPLALYLIGIQSFILVINLTGALVLGIEGTLVLVMAEALWTRRHRQAQPRWSSVVLAWLLMAGVLIELWTQVGRLFR